MSPFHAPLATQRTVSLGVLIRSSSEERSLQASAIKNTLEIASRTIEWLGPTNSTLTTAFDNLQTLAQSLESVSISRRPAIELDPISSQATSDCSRQATFVPTGAASGSQHRYLESNPGHLLLAMLEECYIIPELVLSAELVVILGHSSVVWKDFVAASRAYPVVLAGAKAEVSSEEFMQALQVTNFREIAIWRHRNDDGLELLPMTHSSRECSSSDPREILFSMLPITRRSKRAKTNIAPKSPNLRPDYSKSETDPDSPRLVKMVEKNYDCFDFSQGVDEFFGDYNAIYIKKRPRHRL